MFTSAYNNDVHGSACDNKQVHHNICWRNNAVCRNKHFAHSMQAFRNTPLCKLPYGMDAQSAHLYLYFVLSQIEMKTPSPKLLLKIGSISWL